MTGSAGPAAPDALAQTWRLDRALLWPTAAAAVVPVLLLVVTWRRPLWLDEAASATLAELPRASFRHVLLDREGNGLLHTVLLRQWQHLGLSDPWSRLPSVVAGLVALVVLTVLADRLLGRQVALLVPVLLVSNPMFVRYVVETRSYALLLALVSCGTALLLRALSRQSVLSWLAYAAVMGAAVYAHYFAVLVVVAHGVAVLGRLRGLRVLPVLPGAGLYLLAVVGTRRLMTADAASGVGYLASSPFTRAATAVLVVTTPLAVVGLGTLAVRRRAAGRPALTAVGPERWPYLLLVCWFVVPLALAGAVSALRSPVLAPRYLLVCLPPAVLLLAAVLGRFPRVARLLATGVIAVTGLALGLVYLDSQTEDWDGAAHAVQQRSLPGDEVLFVAPYVRIPFERHWDVARAQADDVRPAYPDVGWGEDTGELFFDVPLAQADVQRAVSDAGRVWVVVSHVDIYGQGDPAYTRAVHGLEGAFGRVQVRQLHGVRVELWARDHHAAPPS